MVQETSTDLVRINARKTDVFDLFNCLYYVGSNPYLDTGALVFDFAVVEDRKLLPIEDYITRVGDRYPHLREQNYESYAHLFAQTVSEVGKLDMNLHFHRWSVKPYSKYTKIAVQSLHERTIRSVVYLVWDWFEAINQDDDFFWDDQLVTLQNRFRQSVYGAPQFTPYCEQPTKKVFPPFICGTKD